MGKGRILLEKKKRRGRSLRKRTPCRSPGRVEGDVGRKGGAVEKGNVGEGSSESAHPEERGTGATQKVKEREKFAGRR